MKQVSVYFEQKFPLNICEKCQMQFVVLAIVGDVGQYAEQDFEQGTLEWYCPYCGRKQGGGVR